LNNTDFISKIYRDREYTDSNKHSFSENTVNRDNIYSDSIWTDPINIDPSVAVANGYAVFHDKLVLTPDPNNPTKVFRADGYTDFIPIKYGIGYQAKLYDNDDNEIHLGEQEYGIEWFWDAYSGILSIGNPGSYTTPYKLSFYRYIGRKSTDLFSKVDTLHSYVFNNPNGLLVDSKEKTYSLSYFGEQTVTLTNNVEFDIEPQTDLVDFELTSFGTSRSFYNPELWFSFTSTASAETLIGIKNNTIYLSGIYNSDNIFYLKVSFTPTNRDRFTVTDVDGASLLIKQNDQILYNSATPDYYQYFQIKYLNNIRLVRGNFNLILHKDSKLEIV
jgi:hypothetical protein